MYFPNTYHKTVIAKNYWLGIFPCTLAQYERITTGKSTDTDAKMYPDSGNSYITIRGTSGAGANVGNGIMKTLAVNTSGKGRADGAFDLPTESMWEIAARAGDTTGMYLGGSISGIAKYAWTGSVNKVGLKDPNAWGFYDQFGNRWERCRDVKNTADLATLQSNGLAPITTSSTSSEMAMRGSSSDGTTGSAEHWLRYSGRHGNQMNGTWGNVTFRIAFVAE